MKKFILLLVILLFSSTIGNAQIKLKSSENLIFQSEIDSIINLNYSEIDFNDMKAYFKSDIKFQEVLSTNASKGDKEAKDLLNILKGSYYEAVKTHGKDNINLLIHTHKKSKEILEKFKALEDKFEAELEESNSKTDSLKTHNEDFNAYIEDLKSKEKLELSGTIEAPNKTNFELANCIANSAMIMGITNYTDLENDALESSFVEGNYSYSYYVDNYESQAGTISFNFLYNIKDGIIYYYFFDFNHNGTDTNFKSIGTLPKLWNEDIGEVFTEKQYSEIMTDINTNINNAIRMITKYCIN